ncbi:uncharacterized protein STEHIDRAFT_153468 [Stereum hirsutum FP-91666 SS1]|uniref:uncharacterized protein n=1 Tax=Stereum hirsutum (strain FP-91666) TaxID=721885 RepID=UPI000440D972|nr:uncharacterized protein STEHIDRAFT_153468 [Stereum hirsutum FP-91666 SS1]EIM89621.1 hypothetical protein STEHIDRAFT_153468 [Stereum hirsutum FP-91666 SS1]
MFSSIRTLSTLVAAVALVIAPAFAAPAPAPVQLAADAAASPTETVSGGGVVITATRVLQTIVPYSPYITSTTVTVVWTQFPDDKSPKPSAGASPASS